MLCHAIVWYTTTENETRKAISDYVVNELKGTPIDQSTFLIKKEHNVREKLKKLCQTLSFDPEATLQVCHSAELYKENFKDSGKDKMVVFAVVEKGEVIS